MKKKEGNRKRNVRRMGEKNRDQIIQGTKEKVRINSKTSILVKRVKE